MDAKPAIINVSDDRLNFDRHQEVYLEQEIARSLIDLRADRLTYIADMIRELQVMAQETKCQTLAGILGLAQAEAMQQRVGQNRDHHR